MSRLDVLVTLMRRELGESLRSRWFLAYSGIFLVGAFAFTMFGLSGSEIYGYRGMAKVLAGLVHLALLFVPLMALFPASASIAGEREVGGLEYLASQPISFGQLFLGKRLGVSLAVWLSLLFGFGIAGAAALYRGAPWTPILLLVALTVLLAEAFVAIGLLGSVFARSRNQATSAALVAWVVAVGLGTLGVMGALIRWGLPPVVLAAWALINPVETFRVGLIASLDTDGSLMGPVGMDLIARFGSVGLVSLCLGILVLWAVVPTLLAWRRFTRPGAGSLL